MRSLTVRCIALLDSCPHAGNCIGANQLDHRNGEGCFGRRAARRDRRSVEPGADRKDAFGRHQRFGPRIRSWRCDPGTYTREVRAARLLDGDPRRHRADVGLHGDDQRRPESRHARRDADRHRRVADRRHVRASPSARGDDAEVRDALPTGRNIQAVGIMIPGTAARLVGGGGALSRDVGGSGNLQQSPLQYARLRRHGADD